MSSRFTNFGRHTSGKSVRKKLPQRPQHLNPMAQIQHLNTNSSVEPWIIIVAKLGKMGPVIWFSQQLHHSIRGHGYVVTIKNLCNKKGQRERQTEKGPDWPVLLVRTACRGHSSWWCPTAAREGETCLKCKSNNLRLYDTFDTFRGRGRERTAA